MGVYDRQIAQVNRQVTAKGEQCIWNQASAPVVADPTKPWITSKGQPEAQTVSILFTSSASNALARLLAGSNVETGKLRGIMPAQSFTPDLNDQIVRSDGTVLELDSVEPLAPNGQVILWWLGFKQ
jgi:hypothetical protein